MISIVDKKDCCGCSACYSICPKQCICMNEDSEGCLYPTVDISACIDCGLCDKVCPVLSQGESRMPIEVLAAKSKDEGQRLTSSSGGIFSLLAEWIINQGGVVFGARFDENWDIIHDWTDTIDGLAPFRGSKYVQSNMRDCFTQAKKHLQVDRWVLFSGTACQIAGLKNFLLKDYEKLLTVDVICHGAPVPQAWRDYLKEFNPCNDITRIAFRDKSNGWQNFTFELKSKSASIKEPFYFNPFMQGFLANLYLRPSCYSCPAKSGRCGSDITLGDFWGINNYHPKINDDKGISAVLAYTEKGKTILNRLGIVFIPSTYDSVLAGNHSLEHSVGIHPKRDLFFILHKSFSKKIKSCIQPTIINRIEWKLFSLLPQKVKGFIIKLFQ